MENSFVGYLGLFVLIVIVSVAFFVSFAERRRRGQMREQAALLGFSYEERRQIKGEPYRELRIFKRGHQQRVKNILSRRTDRIETLILDFSYTQRGGRSSSDRSLTVLLKRFPGFSELRFELRQLTISAEGRARAGDFLASSSGLQNIDFPEDPEFCSRYLLLGEHERRTRGIFTAPIRLRLRGRTGWFVEGGGEWLAAYQDTGRVRPENLSGFIQEAEQLIEIIAGAAAK